MINRNKQRRRGDFRAGSLSGRGSRVGHVQRKEREMGREPGEAALGCGELAGLFRSSGFLLRALGASEGLPWGKVHTYLCPLNFFSTLIQPPCCILQGHGTIHCKVVSGPGQGCWWPGCKLWQCRWRGEDELRDLGETARLWRPLKAHSPLQCGRQIQDVMKMKNEDKEKGPEGLISRSVGLNYVLCQCILFSTLVSSFFPNHMHEDIN